MSSPFGSRIQYKPRPEVPQLDVSVPTTTSDNPAERRRIAFEAMEEARQTSKNTTG